MRLSVLPIAVLAVSCGGIDVPPPDVSFDPGTDVGDEVSDVPDPGDSNPDTAECLVHEDCDHLAPQTCMAARCNEARQCVLEPLSKDTPCEDDPLLVDVCKVSACDGEGQCKARQDLDGTPCVPVGEPPGLCEAFHCQGGDCLKALDCDDGNPCTKDFCNIEKEECHHTHLNEGPCDDENLCTMDDQCFAGVCDGVTAQCNDDNPCTKDLCAPQEGCLHPPDNGAPCEDGSLCTLKDKCYEGSCDPGAILVCVDGNHCTEDHCDTATGNCVFQWNTKACSDGDPCTEGDTCQEGACQPGGPTDCNDGEPCTIDTCDPNQGCLWNLMPGCLNCKLDEECDDGNQCTEDLCELEGPTGKCATVLLSDVPCVDQDPCKIGDTCVEGVCVSGETPNCHDGNPCTNDVCNQLDGACEFVPNELACDDGDDCSVSDHCVNGACEGTLIQCNDQNNCTLDFCEKGGCEFVPQDMACNDGNPCTNDDHCQGNVCAGSAKDCDDGDACTIDICDKEAGCVHWAIVDCLSCTLSSDCDDQNQCTKDVCNQAFQCQWAPKDGQGCDDGSKCTELDICEEGDCIPGGPVDCNDQKECTEEFCDPQEGCVFVPVAGTCDDGDPDTGPDQCMEGECVAGPLLNCDGKSDGTFCSDQDDGTDPDYCITGQCRGFRKSNFSEGTNSTWLTDVDIGSGKAFITGYHGSDDDPTGFVASVSFEGTPTIIQSTTAAGRAYRAVSHLMAVGDGGLVAYSSSWSGGGNTWVKGGVIALALADEGQTQPGDLTGVFGNITTEVSTIPFTGPAMPPWPGDCVDGDQYVVVGRFDGPDPAPLARHCQLGQVDLDGQGCITQASCGNTQMENVDAGSVHPTAVAGKDGNCGADHACLSEALFAGTTSTPTTGLDYEGIFQGQSPDGTLFEKFTLVDGLPAGSGGPVRDMVRVVDANGQGVYVAVGDTGLLAYGDPTGPFKTVGLTAAMDSYDFTSVAVSAQYLFVAGTRYSGNAKALVLLLHDLAMPLDDPDGYRELVIDWCPTQPCEPFALNGVTVSGDQVFLVGHHAGGIDGGAEGVVYFLKL